jgi:hypothetical protein
MVLTELGFGEALVVEEGMREGRIESSVWGGGR